MIATTVMLLKLETMSSLPNFTVHFEGVYVKELDFKLIDLKKLHDQAEGFWMLYYVPPSFNF
jgi:hypothetical protein